MEEEKKAHLKKKKKKGDLLPPPQFRNSTLRDTPRFSPRNLLSTKGLRGWSRPRRSLPGSRNLLVPGYRSRSNGGVPTNPV